MSLRSRLADAIAGKKDKQVGIRQKSSYQIHVNALCSAYENLFAQVRPLINDMKAVLPYGVGRNGARLPYKRTPEIEKLFDPNVTMGWAEFSDAMFATWLTEDELNVRVHFDDKKRGRKNVLGYTILPVGSRRVDSNGRYYWYVEDGNGGHEIGDEQVITLRFSRNPRNLDKGVSPASATFIWSQIDDLVSQYQKAFFENGAVPATITFIKATTRESYEKKRAELETGLSGAKNRNKTVYVWRQLLDDGSEGDELEVKTIQGNNATLAIKDIIGIVNDKLNKAIGVSNFILGDDSSAKYDNAELSDYQFIKRRVYPALMSFWGQFQHELDRITGGLGYGIQFDLELPELTERLKVKAETAKVRMETLTELIERGATAVAACNALGLGKSWLPAAQGVYENKLREDRLEQQYTAVPTSYGADSAQEAYVIEDKAESGLERKLDANNSDSDYGYAPVFAEGEEKAKAIYDMLVDYAQQIFEQDPTLTPDELVDRLYDVLMEDAQDGVIQGVDSVKGLLYGKEVAEEIGEAFSADYHISESFRDHLKIRTSKLVENYGKEAQSIMTSTLNNAASEGWSASKLKTELAKVLPRSRAELIARNETVYALKAGRLESDKYIEQNYGVKIGIEWKISDNGACDVCKAMDGKIVAVGEAFPEEAEYTNDDGEVIKVKCDHNSWNDNGETPNAHANCRCYFNEVVLD